MKNINLRTYSDVSRWTLSGIMLIVCCAISAVVIMVVSGVLQFVPFNENTAIALLVAFAGGIGLCALLLVLNIASNISMIAAVSLHTKGEALVKNQPDSSFKKIFVLTSLLAFIGLSVVIGGTIFSKQQFKKIFLEQAATIIEDNNDLMVKIAKNIPKMQHSEFAILQQAHKEVSQAMKIIESQKSNIPTASVIWEKTVLGKKVYDFSSSYFYYQNQTDERYDELYQCSSPASCQWIKDFFAEKVNDSYFESSFTNSEYRIYKPINIDGQKFILLLEKRQSHGKVGS